MLTLFWVSLLSFGGLLRADKFEEDNYGVKYASNCEGILFIYYYQYTRSYLIYIFSIQCNSSKESFSPHLL